MTNNDNHNHYVPNPRWHYVLAVLIVVMFALLSIFSSHTVPDDITSDIGTAGVAYNVSG